MNRYTTYYFYFSLLVGSLVYSFQKFTAIQVPMYLNNYLNDFLFTPIILFVCLKVIIAIKRDIQYRLPLWIILYVCLMVSLAFEYYFPKILMRYTSDLIDVLLYFLSGFLFYFLQNIESYRTDSSQKPFHSIF